MAKEYEVTVPFAGHMICTVEAETEEEAIEKAIDRCTLSDVESWEAVQQFNEGNICYCPHPWEAEAQCISDE